MQALQQGGQQFAWYSGLKVPCSSFGRASSCKAARQPNGLGGRAGRHKDAIRGGGLGIMSIESPTISNLRPRTRRLKMVAMELASKLPTSRLR